MTKAAVTNTFTDPAQYTLQEVTELNFRTTAGDGSGTYLVAPDGTRYTVGISADGGNAYSYFYVIGSSIANIPSGDWMLTKADGSQLAVADLAFANPCASDGLPVGFIPSIKLVVDSSDIVKSIDVIWYWHDEAGVFTKVDDLTVVNHCCWVPLYSTTEEDQAIQRQVEPLNMIWVHHQSTSTTVIKA